MFLSRKTANEDAVMRGSRTRSIPLATRYRSLARLTRRSFRKPRCDHPSLTLALMPSAPSLKRTARTERPRRWAIFVTGFVAGPIQKLVVILWEPWPGERSRTGAVICGLLPNALDDPRHTEKPSSGMRR